MKSIQLLFFMNNESFFSHVMQCFLYFRKKFTKYSLESRLHFRVHSNIEAIKEEMKSSSRESTSSGEDDSVYDVVEIPDADVTNDYVSEFSSNKGIPLRKETSI